MPFRHLYRQYDGSHDFHNQQRFQSHQPSLAIVDPEQAEYQWHEMDFTTEPLSSPGSPQSQQQKFPAPIDRNMESLSYLRSSDNQLSLTGRPQQSPSSISGDLYSTGPFSYSQLLNMESDLTSIDQSSLSSSRADSNMLNDSNNPHTLDGSPVSTLDPSTISLSSTPLVASKGDPTEKLCPLIAGQVDSCQPSRCGPDAPCMNFTTLPPIEECTSVPCMDNSANEIMITRDSVRPSVSTRSSATSFTRRSSASSNEQGASVPLPRRTSAGGPRRRPTRSSTTTTAITTPSDDEDEEPTKSKPVAPSKADAKTRAKQAHSLVERKYRENLNAKIAQLHQTLQASHYGPRIDADNDEEVPSAGVAVPASKVRKSDVLTEAMNYVNQTEVEMRHMENEIARLGERVRVLEKLVRCEDCSLLKQMVSLQVQAIQ